MNRHLTLELTKGIKLTISPEEWGSLEEQVELQTFTRYDDYAVGEVVKNKLYVVGVDNKFWEVAMLKNDGAQYDYGVGGWSEVGELIHPSALFNVPDNKAIEMNVKKGYYKIKKLKTYCHPVVHKGLVEDDRVIVNINCCEFVGESLNHNYMIETNERWTNDFNSFYYND